MSTYVHSSPWHEERTPPSSGSWLETAPFQLPAGIKVCIEQLVHIETSVFLAVVFLIGVVIRMVALLGMRQISHLPGRQAGADGIEFERLARALAEGRGYVKLNGLPTAFRAPGFPIFVSFIYRMSRMSVSIATLSFPVLGAAICVVTYLLAREVVPETTARLAALLGTVYFPAIYLSTIWFSEPLFMFVFALSLTMFLVYRRTGHCSTLAVAGLLFSYSVLIRPFAILMLPGLLVLDFIYSRKRRLTVPLLLVCSLVPTLLWTARNYRIYHHFVLVTTNGGSTFYGGNNDTVLRVPEQMGSWVSTVRLPGRDQVVATHNEYDHDQVEWRLGKQWMRSHLTVMPILITMKLVRFVLPDFASQSRKFAALSVVTTLPFLPLWILGLRASAERKNWTVAWSVVHMGVAMTVFTAMAFWGSPRFRDGVAPLLFIYSAFGLQRWFASRLPHSEAVRKGMAVAEDPHALATTEPAQRRLRA